MPDQRVIAQVQGQQINDQYNQVAQEANSLYSYLTARQSQPFNSDSDINDFNSKLDELTNDYSKLDQLTAQAVDVNQRLKTYGDQYAEGVPMMNIFDWSGGDPNAAPSLPSQKTSIWPFFLLFGAVYFFYIKGKKR